MSAGLAGRRSPPGGDGALRLQILHVAGCPNLDALRHRVERSLARLGLSATIEEVEARCSSPTLLVNGTDVTKRDVAQHPSCRLDLPTAEEIAAALLPVAGLWARMSKVPACQAHDSKRGM
ncbi:MAG TPA: hypothetical protein DCQ30_09595 [Acidimicrobiaceae bacterium]|nr:hypothetical protein [Acidimicrobiaceae bacterium]